MHSPPPRISNRLRRAAAAERALVAQRRARVEGARARVQTELERLDRELADIDHHIHLLAQIAPGAQEEPPHRNGDTRPRLDPGAPRVLRGPAIRQTAVRALVEQYPPVEAIHYRDWYRLLQEHGYAVAGKKPLAVFLSQVSRSPVMRKSTAAGVYALDRDAVERIRRELSELEAQLHELTGGPGTGPAGGGVQARRRELLLAIGRHERALAEALRGVSSADPGQPGGAGPIRG
jgi:hypothetical protein